MPVGDVCLSPLCRTFGFEPDYDLSELNGTLAGIILDVACQLVLWPTYGQVARHLAIFKKHMADFIARHPDQFGIEPNLSLEETAEEAEALAAYLATIIECETFKLANKSVSIHEAGTA